MKDFLFRLGMSRAGAPGSWSVVWNPVNEGDNVFSSWLYPITSHVIINKSKSLQFLNVGTLTVSAVSLIVVLENPGEWGEGWGRHWREKLGEDYNKVSAEWLKLKPFDRNTSFSLADLLEVEKNTLPCIVFIESFEDNKILCIPLIADKTGYPKYLDIFAAVNRAVEAPTGERLQALRSEWRKPAGFFLQTPGLKP